MAQRSSRFKLKAWKPRPMDEEQAEKIWSSLSDAIGEIHNQNASSLSFEELYRNAYNLVLHKYGSMLYSRVEETVRKHLSQIGKELASVPDEYLLAEISEKWYYHKTTMVMIRDILMYMDRVYVTQTKKSPVYDMGLIVFRDVVVRQKEVSSRLLRLLLGNIARERSGELIDRDQMRTILYMMVELSISSEAVYENDFETPFLQATQQFYQSESNKLISQTTCPDYLRITDKRLTEERKRAQQYLFDTTEPKLMRLVERELIEQHAKTIVEMPGSGCVTLFRDDKIEDLHLVYRLFSRVEHTLAEVRTIMSNYIKEEGCEYVDESKGPTTSPIDFVKGLLDMRDKYERITVHAFEQDKSLQKTLKLAFEFFINKNKKCAKYLSLYVDDMLKSKMKGQCDDTQMEEQLDKVIVIFRYLQDKDVFESYYKQHLAKRLLSGRSVSDDTEHNMIAKLKTECGYQFTSKLEGMFKDMKLSKETMDLYRAYIDKNGGPTFISGSGPEINVNVLTTGNWPTIEPPHCNLPANVAECAEHFKSFYLKNHNGRRLTWQTNMGNASIRAVFAPGVTHELNVSTFQMSILDLFNQRTTMTFADIAQETNITEAELKRHLISLAAPKFRILVKEPRGKAIEGEHKFTVNEKFKSKLFRVRIPLISIREKAKPEGKSVPANVEEDRRHLIEAAVVRIMKTRKQLQHNLLIAEVTKQLSSRFRPGPQQIKKRIESLIEREYLERDKEDRKMYVYLA